MMADDRRQQLADGIFAALNATNPLHYQDAADEVADALLPLLDRVAADAAAEALDGAVQWQQQRLSFWSPPSTEYAEGRFDAHDVTANDLRARAAELRAPARTDEEN